MSRRRRAILFALAAGLCAALAARSVSGYSRGLEAQLGPLRPAVVARVALPAKRAIGAAATGSLEVRRVPARFLPPGVLSAPAEAIGRAPAAAIPAGAYLLGSQLREPGARSRDARPLGSRRTPVEVAVAGATALATRLGARGGLRVDVIVTSEPRTGSGEGRTYVAARGVRLLDLGEPGAADGGDVASALPDASIATLALTRPQALKLIHAQNFAREVRLVASGD